MTILDIVLDTLPEWMADAEYAEHAYEADRWWPTTGQSADYAVAICRRCLVQLECFDYALAQGPGLEGVWGGTGPRERRAMLRAAASIAS